MPGFVYDPTDADFAAHAFSVYRELRDHHPVYRHPAQGYYALSRFEDVRWASQDSERFSSEATQTAVEGLPQLQALDAPYHDELRGLVSSAFTPRRVAALEGRIRAMVTRRIDAFAARGHCDLLADFARSIPNQVISELIGIPRERQPAFLELALSIVEADAEGASHAEKLRPAAEKIGEEFAQLLWRVVRRDVRRHGVTIPEGAELRLLWGAANHDEREFAEPERFDVFRESPRHLGFGVGRHFCLGANLARLEARVMFEEVLARIPEYELASELEWLPSVWARAYRRVPVRFAPLAPG